MGKISKTTLANARKSIIECFLTHAFTMDIIALDIPEFRSWTCSILKTAKTRYDDEVIIHFADESDNLMSIRNEVISLIDKTPILKRINGKLLTEITEEEYQATDEGLLDVFCFAWEEAQKHKDCVNFSVGEYVFVRPVKKLSFGITKKVEMKEVEKEEDLTTLENPVFNQDLEEKIKQVSEVKRVKRQVNSKTSRVGFKSLGYKDEKNYVWSNYKQALFTITHKDFTLNNYINMFGLNYLQENFKKYSPKGADMGIDTQTLTGILIDNCVDQGVFNLTSKFGFGIFVDPKDKDHLIVNGEDIWGTNPEFNGERIQGKNVYANIKDLDFPQDTQVATLAETKEWFDLLGTWNYKRGLQDQLLVFGWSIVAPFAGCLNWRTHFSLTGEQGTGKSTLQTCAGNYMGEFALVFDGQSTEAGIRQKVGSSSCAVLIDEAEANSNKIAQTLTFFRTASSSGIVAKGTSDQEGMDFILKLTGMIGGIVAPALNPADLSRFLRIELLPKGEKVHPLLLDIDKQNEIGKKTIMFIIQNYKMFKKVCKTVRKCLLQDYDNSRYADSFTTLIAGAYIGLNQDADEVKIKEFMTNFNFEKEKIQMANKDHNNLLNKVLKTSLKADIGSYSVIEMINGVFHNDNNQEVKKDIKRTLGRNGMKVEETETSFKLFIATKDDNFLKMFKFSKFDAGDISSVITRIDGSELLKDSIMIGGTHSQRSTVVVIDLPKKDYSFKEEDNMATVAQNQSNSLAKQGSGSVSMKMA